MTGLQEVEATIATLDPEVQIRINTIVDILRALAASDTDGETEFAMLLVMEEINEDDVAIAEAEAKGAVKQ
jgi:hypothetical protein